MAKKEEKLKVLTINEDLIGKMNDDIKDLIILNSQSMNFYEDLTPHTELCDAGNKDIEYLVQNSKEDLVEYVLTKRSMLIDAYKTKVFNATSTLAECAFVTYNNLLSEISPDLFNLVDISVIKGIIVNAYYPDPRSYNILSISDENAQDMIIINNVIPSICLKLNAYLYDTFTKTLEASFTGDFEKYSTIKARACAAIENITFSMQTSLVGFYCEVKEYIKDVIVPTGYPEITFHELCDGECCTECTENNKE